MTKPPFETCTQFLGIFVLLLILDGNLSAQVYYDSNIINYAGQDEQESYLTVTANSASNLAETDDATPSTGNPSLGMEFTVNPSNLTLGVNGITTSNLLPPAVTNTATYSTGFNSTDNITTHVTFNPINFSVQALPNQLTLMPASGYSQPTYYVSSFQQQVPATGLYLTGTYLVSDSTASASGSFSVPLSDVILNVNPSFQALLQTGGYPGSVSIPNSSSVLNLIEFDTTSPIFNVNLGGVTVTGTNTTFRQFVEGGVFQEVPEPAAWSIFLMGAAVWAFTGVRRGFKALSFS